MRQFKIFALSGKMNSNRFKSQFWPYKRVAVKIAVADLCGNSLSVLADDIGR
jgi:hypothetical protein